jgi:hypothetical protein
MKPRLRMNYGYWQCGVPGDPSYCWSLALTWREAYALWKRVRQ